MSNMTSMKTFNRPEITDEKIELIKRLIEENPNMGRSRLSEVLCEKWDWRSSNGKTKSMSCRDLLLSLEKAGKIVLPERKTTPRRAGDRKKILHLEHDQTPITCNLKELRPLQVEIVSSKDKLVEFKSYIDQFHYLAFDRYIGEHMAYMIRSRDGVVLSCLLFGSAAWSCRDRDRYIGWGKEQRSRSLNYLTNNVRYLVNPWVRVPCLASHILSLITKRISADWEAKYGHPIYALETFVEVDRFRAVCYRAANWIRVGSTTGRGRDGGHHHSILPVKDIYFYPLDAEFRQKLTNRKGLPDCND